MKDFYEKWHSDSKYRTKIKLLAYTLFFIVVSVYALSINKQPPQEQNIKDDEPEIKENVFEIPAKYSYLANITINENEYKYSGKKEDNKKTIIKESDDIITNYIYQDGEYYILTDDTYLKTTKEDVYDIVNYNYLNLENINKYLEKATVNNNQYLVYIKDIVLGNDSNDYFVILLKDGSINIDYTPLIKYFDPNIQKYKVEIEIEKED